MTNPKPTDLRVQRCELRQRLAKGLAEQSPLAELQDVQARLQLIDCVLAARAPRGRAVRRHLVALLVVAAVVSLAALVPLSRVAFLLELEAGAVQMQMRDAGHLAGQSLDGTLRAEGFSRVESADPTLLQRFRDGGASQLELQAQSLRLQRISFPAGASLDFKPDAQAVRLAIDGAPHSAELQFSGQASINFAGAPHEPRSYAIVEWIKLVSDATPSELWFARKPERNYLWRGLQPISLRVVERQLGADGQVRLVSALHRAILRLPATGRDLPLMAGSSLELDGLQLHQAELALGEQLTLKLVGSVQRLVVDIGGFKHSVKPSLLEYAANNHSLVLLWSAAGLLWGSITWLRKLFGDNI